MNLSYKLKFNPLTWYVRQTANRLGFDICTYPNVRALLNDCDLAIDAGANNGCTRDWMRQLGYRGRIASFEPNPKLSAQMLLREDDRWQRYNCALSDKEVEMDFYVRESDLMSGLLKMDGLKDSETLRLVTRRLDSVLADDSAKNIFLKIDCEGHDLAVLRGAERILPRVRIIMMEVATRARYVGEPNFLEVAMEVQKLGFQVSCSLQNLYADQNRRAAAIDVIFEPIT